MLDRKHLRNHSDQVHKSLARRGFVFDSKHYHELETSRQMIQTECESLRAEMNRAAKEVGIQKSQGNDIEGYKEEMSKLSQRIKDKQKQLSVLQQEIDAFEMSLPNMPHDSTPDGLSEDENVEIKRWGTPLDDRAYLDHATLAEPHGMSFKQGAVLSGSRFVVLHADMARLSRALGNWMIDTHVERHGYQEVNVPVLVGEHCMYGTGQLPKFADDQFFLRDDPLVLIPTAEVPITNLYRDTIVPLDELPKKFVAQTECFRREAGSAGRDTQGMIRMHQFTKVELVQILPPGQGLAALDELISHAEYLLQQLQLPYRAMSLCGGDIGFSAAKTVDLEVWIPEQKRYREISSCSYFGDFQARRMMMRTKVDGKSVYVETINGSGLPLGRTLIAICENFQQADGSIIVPEVLRPYMGKDIIKAAM